MPKFQKKAGEVFHLDEWNAFLCEAAFCWDQPLIDDQCPGDECHVTRDLSVTIEAAAEAAGEK